MAMISFLIEENELQLFKLKVGEGNMSSYLRNFIISTINTPSNEDEKKVFKELQRKKEELDNIQKQFNLIKAKADRIDTKNRIEEEKQEQMMEEERKNRKQMERDTIRAFKHKIIV